MSRTVTDTEGNNWIRSTQCEYCIEVSPRKDYVFIRDSREPTAHIKVTALEFKSFLTGVKLGDFDSITP